MPHITDGSWKGMPSYNTTVTPVNANAGNPGGGCYDGKGQALWAQKDSSTGKVMCYRTRNSWRSLTEENNSVDPIVVIHGGKWLATACSMWRIGGRPYVVISGMQDINYGPPPTIVYLGVWRDTSPDGDGTGPWVEHGVIRNDSCSRNDGRGVFAGEILVQNGVWALTATSMHTPTPDFMSAQYVIAHSTDAGRTWTADVVDSGYAGAYMSGGSNNFAKWGNWWVVGDDGNVHGIQTWSSQDLVNWVAGGDGWNGYNTYNVGVSSMICSTPSHVWTNVPGGAGSSGDPTNAVQYVVGGDPFDGSTHNWVSDRPFPNAYGGQHYGLLFNIGPDVTPFWAMQQGGYVGANLGWVVGSVGRLPNVGTVE